MTPPAASVKFFGDPIDSDAGATPSPAPPARYSELPGGRASLEHVRSPQRGLLRRPVFTPGNTLKLKRATKKQLGIYAKAKDGGRATGARWTLLSPVNADLHTGLLRGPRAEHLLHGHQRPEGEQVKVTVKFTSTAGVGKDLDAADEGGRRSTTSAGPSGASSNPPAGPLHTWSGSASFDRIGPSPSSGAAGILRNDQWLGLTHGLRRNPERRTGIHVPGLRQPGRLFRNSEKSAASPFSYISKLGPDPGPPYEYSFEVFLPGTVPPEEGPLEDKVTIEFSNCGEKSDELNGTTDEIPAAWDLVLFENQPSDGVTFAGSIEEVVGSVTREKHWSLHGSP